MSKEFSNRKKELIGDLLWEIQKVYGSEYNEEMKRNILNWFGDNFEQFHIKSSISVDMLKHLNNDQGHLDHQDKSACYSLIDALKEQSIVETPLDHPKDEFDKIRDLYSKEKTFSILTMRRR